MHVFANPARFLSIARPLTPWLFWGGLLLLLIGTVAGLFFAPPEHLPGDRGPIMYVQLPAALLCQGRLDGRAIASLVPNGCPSSPSSNHGPPASTPGAVFSSPIYSAGRKRWNRVCPCASRLAWHGRLDRDCDRQPGTDRLASSTRMHSGPRHCRAGGVVYRHLSCDGLDLGPSNLGDVVGMGWPHDEHAGAAVPLSGLYRACQCKQRQ